MGAARTATEVLMAELRDRAVVPEPYSRRSLLGRSIPALSATALALLAIIGGMLLGEVTPPGIGRPEQQRILLSPLAVRRRARSGTRSPAR